LIHPKPVFLDTAEAAEFLRIGRSTLYRLVEQRKVPFRRAGGKILFLQDELIAWTEVPRPDEIAEQSEEKNEA
jgi:excisionase family DNA binding protein